MLPGTHGLRQPQRHARRRVTPLPRLLLALRPGDWCQRGVRPGRDLSGLPGKRPRDGRIRGQREDEEEGRCGVLAAGVRQSGREWGRREEPLREGPRCALDLAISGVGEERLPGAQYGTPGGVCGIGRGKEWE